MENFQGTCQKLNGVPLSLMRIPWLILCVMLKTCALNLIALLPWDVRSEWRVHFGSASAAGIVPQRHAVHWCILPGQFPPALSGSLCFPFKKFINPSSFSCRLGNLGLSTAMGRFPQDCLFDKSQIITLKVLIAIRRFSVECTGILPE